MRTWLAAVAALALVVAAAAGARTHTTYHPITIDGSCADWSSDEIFPTADAGFDVRITWDDSTIYIGWKGEPTSELSRYAAFDLDKGVVNGSNAFLGTTDFASNGQPEYAVEYSFGNNQDFLFFYRRNGDGFDSSPTNPLGTDGAFGATGCGGEPFAEVSLDRELFDIANPFGSLGPDVSGLIASDDVAIYAWTQVGEGQIEGSMPAANQNTTPLLHQAYCQTTDGGRKPNEYCVPTTAVRVASFAVHGRTLTWRTASEAGVLGFELRRNGRKLAFVRARGGASGASYRYVDRTARPGPRHVYRLRVVRY